MQGLGNLMMRLKIIIFDLYNAEVNVNRNVENDDANDNDNDHFENWPYVVTSTVNIKNIIINKSLMILS